ncbi:MAG: hypothetical protein FWE25_09725 [Lachnospiraceae bacterium]|nr:hypothetical protein [Lachnospiraceae bacterium]
MDFQEKKSVKVYGKTEFKIITIFIFAVTFLTGCSLRPAIDLSSIYPLMDELNISTWD